MSPGRRPPPRGPTRRDRSPCADEPVGPVEPTVRLFAGVWPPPDVVALLASLERPKMDAVRWTTPDQWHVTLAFLGNVPVSLIDALEAALGAATARVAAPPEARLGPVTQRVGRSVLCVPVEGLDQIAAEVRRALGALLPDAGLDRPFAGHLTLARSRGHRTVPASLGGALVEAGWRAREVSLVRSELDPKGARYTTLATAAVPS